MDESVVVEVIRERPALNRSPKKNGYCVWCNRQNRDLTRNEGFSNSWYCWDVPSCHAFSKKSEGKA